MTNKLDWSYQCIFNIINTFNIVVKNKKMFIYIITDVCFLVR